ncbi:626_t:CDS:2 [Ambispora leptoticha]|uniref:626_t:CDS:1 n=1 Tax=Ambispora leptoticha TaxID=144679 RepID=A0A9N9B1K3_9GLOM|nr:626_t:CDS:2 [Ambispora leptoticha]
MSTFHAPIIRPTNRQPVHSASYTILPEPFQSVVVISSTQHQQAQQRVIQIDQEVRSAGVKICLIEDGLSEEEKQRYPTIMGELTPYYAKINRLVPFYYLISKNSDKAARDMLTMKYIIQQQYIALPEEKYIITLDALQEHKDLLVDGNPFTSAPSSNHLDTRLHKPSTPPLPQLSAGVSTLAKFLSLVENYDPLDDTSNRAGDLLITRRREDSVTNHVNIHHGGNILTRLESITSSSTNNSTEISRLRPDLLIAPYHHHSETTRTHGDPGRR